VQVSFCRTLVVRHMGMPAQVKFGCAKSGKLPTHCRHPRFPSYPNRPIDAGLHVQDRLKCTVFS